jgi:hypothetical protein
MALSHIFPYLLIVLGIGLILRAYWRSAGSWSRYWWWPGRRWLSSMRTTRLGNPLLGLGPLGYRSERVARYRLRVVKSETREVAEFNRFDRLSG